MDTLSPMSKLLPVLNVKCVSVCKTGIIPVHIACQYEHESIVQLLLSNTAYIDSFNESGKSPVHKVCQYGHDNIVQLLLNSSTDINICSESLINQSLSLPCVSQTSPDSAGDGKNGVRRLIAK